MSYNHTVTAMMQSRHSGASFHKDNILLPFFKTPFTHNSTLQRKCKNAWERYYMRSCVEEFMSVPRLKQVTASGEYYDKPVGADIGHSLIVEVQELESVCSYSLSLCYCHSFHSHSS